MIGFCQRLKIKIDSMSPKFKIVDLTHEISPQIPTFDGGCGFELRMTTDYKDCKEPNLFRVYEVKFRSGIGTHIDSPAHCIPGGDTIEKMKLEDLITDCIVIRTKDQTSEDYPITPNLIEEFETKNGKIAENTFVIFQTGWEKFWATPDQYVNNHKYPYVHEDTARLLMSRNISGIGVDTLSADSGTEDFPVHRIILGQGKYLVENIANAGMLPEIGAKIFVMPLKMKDATESPVRLVGLIEQPE